jgi:hypothetical protein
MPPHTRTMRHTTAAHRALADVANLEQVVETGHSGVQRLFLVEHDAWDLGVRRHHRAVARDRRSAGSRTDPQVAAPQFVRTA